MTDKKCQCLVSLSGGDKCEMELRIPLVKSVATLENPINTGDFKITISANSSLSHDCLTIYSGLSHDEIVHKYTKYVDDSIDIKDLPF